MNKGPVRVYTIREVDRISLDIYQISKIILPFDRYLKSAMGSWELLRFPEAMEVLSI